jgi:long-chain-fatty-acid--[acyl-carrier-protein] ligase
VRNIVALTLLYFMRFTLWFRYRVTIKGEEYLNPKTLNKPGGVLFLPNHPTVFVDPTLVTLAIWKKYPIRPMIVEYMYYMPVVHWFMKFLNALPVPNFVNASNSLKKKKADKVIDTVIEELRNKENFLIYPAGRVKYQAKEVIGASAVHKIIESVPEANIVLVRTTGLWGSSFSKALNGKSPLMFANIFWGIKKALKNMIFFTPRRHVTIEFVPAPADFPYKACRLEMNQYLENFYNRPDGITKQEGNEPGESLYLVSYSMWKEELPEVKNIQDADLGIDLSKVPSDIQAKVKKEISEMSHIPEDQITPDLNLGSDLGLDSLDNAELLTFLDDNYDISGVPVSEITTVGKVMAIAAKQVTFGEVEEEEQQDLSKWSHPFPHERAVIPEGETIPEVFLNLCEKMSHEALCGDMRAGVITYSQAKLRIVLLAEYIRKLPGEYIGILLPSSVAAYLTIIATQLAGKVPLMINWTVGTKHLETVASLSKVQSILSSWLFLDKLENIDFNGIEDAIITLEDARRTFSLKDKLLAFYRSKLSTKSILKTFGAQNRTGDSKAVLLFTSGTESMPKGVPLTHHNVLSNQRSAINCVEINRDDILLGILPPFHSFGFTVSGLLPLLGGLRVAYYPDPTNGKALAKEIERWGATIVCGAPTFLKGIFKNGNQEQLKTLRLCVTGAEKAPDDLFKMVKQLGHCSLIEGYGITECSPILTVNMSGDPVNGIGKPLDNVELSVIDLETHIPVPQGQRGMILAKGPNIFSGYLNEGLASPFVSLNGQQWYSTGDLGYLNSRGDLILSGRLKRFIKIGGEMISLASIEDSLQKTVGHRGEGEGPSLAVIAKEEAGEKTKIFVFTRFEITNEELNKMLREDGISNLVKVYKVIKLDEIPLMGTGKINYRTLESQIPSNNNQTELTPSKAS